MAELDALRRRVEFALPKPSRFDLENFAGDPHVAEFCRLLCDQLGLDVTVFVAWACPPAVSILRSANGSALIRSERLDTMLVEYHKLATEAQSQAAANVLDELVTSSVLRWMAELLLGFRRPSVALTAMQMRQQLPVRMAVVPFRDESLASVPELERTALQCFLLAHEIGHLACPPNTEATLDTEVDGIPLMRHLERDVALPTITEPVRDQLRRTLVEAIKPGGLLCEVQADLLALECVIQYVRAAFDCSVEEAMRASLRACEATLAINSCIQSCRDVARLPARSEFVQQDFVAGAQMSTRARAIMRRAGILWAGLEKPDRPLVARDINPYVPRVDALFARRQPFLQLVTQKVTDSAQSLIEQHVHLGEEEARSLLAEQMAGIRADHAMRLELFYMLVAFGCPGGTDVGDYIASIPPGPANARG
jgi:hypothetical protein